MLAASDGFANRAAKSSSAASACFGTATCEPTLVRARRDMPILKEEIFAPILYLIEFDDLDQAIHWHNDVPQGLSSAIFTDQPDRRGNFSEPPRQRLRDRERQHRHQRRGDRRGIRRREGDGGGRESGSDAWKAYMRRQTNTINWSTQFPLAQGIQW